MDSSKKRKQTIAPVQTDTPKMKLGIGKPELSPFKPFQPVKKKGWSGAQWEQSKKFWEKKNLKTERQFKALDARRIKAEDTFMSSLSQARKAELTQLSAMKLVTRSKEKQMPDATMSVLPAKAATKRYKDVMSDIGSFLDPKARVRSKFNEGGPQLIQQFTDQHGVSVTRRVGVDVEPSGHVQSLRPHLNLQTQHNGVIQGGPLQDPHHPIRSFDPFRGPGNHPLQGKLTSDEKRAFMERYIRSLGTPIERE